MDIGPKLTYSGAMSIMGRYEHPAIRGLERLFGVLLLGSPLAAKHLLDLLDPKNEAAGLLQDAVNAVTARLYGTAGYQRDELVKAAHAILVASAVFKALQGYFATERYPRGKLNKMDRHGLVAADLPEWQCTDRLVEVLTRIPVPMPSAGLGWAENKDGPLREFMERLALRSVRFVQEVEIWRRDKKGRRPTAGAADQESGKIEDEPSSFEAELLTFIVPSAMTIYAGLCRRFAGDIPEFMAWLILHEHAATRSTVRQLSHTLGVQQAESSRALQRLERNLADATRDVKVRDHRGTLAHINSALMDLPIVATDDTQHDIENLTFPTIRDGYITPSCRVATAQKAARPSHEEWWQEQERWEDLDRFLEIYLRDAAGWRSPMLVLGHPGAGKSLLTKVLAARLPPSSFAVVRVPLRTVSAGAQLFEQISHALQTQTNGRMTWADLTSESRDVVRVVLLDGLDELIQVTGVTQTGYLHEVARFQQQELGMESPVIVIVTSRMIVADRTSLPPGSILLRLEDFDEPRVERWLDVWRLTNQRWIDQELFRALSVEAALRHPDLVRQPLLLLMLALYTARREDPDETDLVISRLGLYQRLLKDFAAREVAKSRARQVPNRPSGADTATNQLWRLGLAAFAMFNRGRQYVSESELEHDMEDIDGGTPSTPRPPASMDLPVSRAMRTIGRFFFVHTAEADGHLAEQARRTYEFLHPTFGEYLIAATTFDLLLDAARLRMTKRNAPYNADVQGPLLASLLSHQAFIKRAPILEFAGQLLCTADSAETTHIREVLDDLCQRSGHVVFGPYDPSGATAVERAASYTVNLLALRALLSPVRLDTVVADGTDPAQWWTSTVRTWHAGLDAESWSVVLATFRIRRTVETDGTVTQWLTTWSTDGDPIPAETLEDLQAAVMADPIREYKYTIGDIVTRYWPVVPTPTVPASVAGTLELALHPAWDRRQHLYEMVLTEPNATAPMTSPMLLASLARDATVLAPYLAIDVFEKLMFAAWQERPDLLNLARVIVATHPAMVLDGQLRRRGRLASFGNRSEWTRAFASALILERGPWPEDPEDLLGRFGEASVRSIEFTDLVYPAEDPAQGPHMTA